MSTDALITPDVLKWARETSGINIERVAAKLSKNKDDILAWEDGQGVPSIPQLRKLASLYKRPLASFYLPEPPKDFSVPRDFRNRTVRNKMTSELRMLFRENVIRQEWARLYLEKENASKLEFVGSAAWKDDIELVAKSIKEVLQVDYVYILKELKSADQALKYWIELAEDAGFFVSRDSKIELNEARGFIISDPYAPFIFINSQDAKPGQIFTLLHEIVHAWLNQSGISNSDFIEKPCDEEEQIESFCNKVAAELITDKSMFISETEKIFNHDELLEVVSKLASRFKVSREYAAIHLCELDKINNTECQILRNILHEEWNKRKKSKASAGGPSPHLMKVINNGASFTRSVITAYRSGTIYGTEVSNLLGVKINHLNKVAAHAGLI